MSRSPETGGSTLDGQRRQATTWAAAPCRVTEDVECRDAEAYLCGRKGRKPVTRRSGGRKGYQRHPGAFIGAADAVKASWRHTAATCSQADRLTAELSRALARR